MSNSPDENTKNLDEFFKEPIKDPFHYNLNLKCNKLEDLFVKIKNIFIKGLIIHAGDEENNTVNIDGLTDKDIKKVSDYMLSIGFDVKFKKYDTEKKDYIFRDFLYDIENFPELDIKVVMDWKTNFITEIKLTALNNNQDTVSKIVKATEKHIHANYFLKIRPVKNLNDFAIFFKKPDYVYTLNFDFLKPGGIPNHIERCCG